MNVMIFNVLVQALFPSMKLILQTSYVELYFLLNILTIETRNIAVCVYLSNSNTTTKYNNFVDFSLSHYNEFILIVYTF